MNFTTKLTASIAAALSLVLCLPASAFPIGKKKQTQQEVRKLTPAQSALIDKAVAREALVVKTLKERTPIVETYIQNMRPDPVMGQTPDADLHFLGRVNFSKVINDTSYARGDRTDSKKGSFFKHSLGYIAGLSAALHLTYHESGFVQMLLVDSSNFNRSTYTFSYLRNDFLGTVPTMVFDVQPTKHNAYGRFAGRIWIERNGGNIVRFNGDFDGGTANRQFFHFDSWRTNVQEGLWMPTSVYVEETDPKSATHSLEFKAINYIWGYSLKTPAQDSDEASLQVEGAVDESAQASDVSPLGAEREWIQQAEDNVIDRLFTAGLIDAPSDFDKTLAALANNILAYNNIPVSRPLKVRILLTEPLESIAVGNTILLSKSLIDTTAIQTTDGAQQMGNLNALLAFQVAHIILGHHIDTKYAFSDRLLFPSESAFQKLPMHHTEADNEAAAKKAMELLSVKDLADGQQYFGLYLQQLQARLKGLKALTDPQIGDSLLKPDGTFWMQAIVSKGPKLNDTDLKQQAAMPLGAFLRFDPWTDQVIQMHSAYEPLLSARDKLPFEVTPVYLKLSYWQPPAAAAPAAPPAASSTGAPAAAPAAAPAGNTAAAPTTGTSNPPQQ
ncbi:hypothetical protein GOB94_04630 [Granulicella sp. 5B5]|uniref:hypothetical protein n=1 Tax=Granulicella sp. 5B5 TaxID=1617967 RepID=UPI0015F37764|nr:hypothetical protein [Granulicella sp. 5B5]QMV18053.1 hypothetical protein GOB94_04630 [Granulicella sp. 5B5]